MVTFSFGPGEGSLDERWCFYLDSLGSKFNWHPAHLERFPAFGRVRSRLPQVSCSHQRVESPESACVEHGGEKEKKKKKNHVGFPSLPPLNPWPGNTPTAGMLTPDPCLSCLCFVRPAAARVKQSETAHGGRVLKQEMCICTPTDAVFCPHFPQIFHGNTDPAEVVLNRITQPVLARFVRIRPQTWKNGIALRFELYGCQISG